MAAPEPSDPRLAHLETLAAAVEEVTDLRAKVVQASGSGPVLLHVVNPHTSDVAEDIGCDLVDGEWWYAWSCNDTIGPADDPEGAAKAIAHVLMVTM